MLVASKFDLKTRISLFSTYQGRQAAKPMYIDYLNQNPYREEVFERFIDYIRALLKVEDLDEKTVLEQGYF